MLQRLDTYYRASMLFAFRCAMALCEVPVQIVPSDREGFINLLVPEPICLLDVFWQCAETIGTNREITWEELRAALLDKSRELRQRANEVTSKDDTDTLSPRVFRAVANQFCELAFSPVANTRFEEIKRWVSRGI